MITIIDYNAGNVASVGNALERLGYEYEVSSDASVIAKAEKVIFPGQGRAGSAMKRLRELGLVDVLRDLRVPFLGICLGLQLMADFTEEDCCECLGIVPGRVVKFPDFVKSPQIGWNKVFMDGQCRLFEGLGDEGDFYFVNSYYLPAGSEFEVARSSYGVASSAVVWRDNFFGVQFHPEKSGEEGIKLLSNFCKL